MNTLSPERSLNTFSRNSLVWISCLAFAGSLLPSCHKDDPVLLRKNQEQKAEIKRLESELAVLEEKLKNAPPDHGEDLAAARKEAENQASEIANLEKEVSGLQERKKVLESELNRYRDSHPVKSN